MKHWFKALGMAVLAHWAPVYAAEGDDPLPGTDRDALIAIYQATDGPNWTKSSGWNTEAEVCSVWHGVTCNAAGRVIALSLAINDLSGALPAKIGDLTELTALALDHNALTGSIPAEIGKLAKLQKLTLHVNQLSGSMPAEMSALTELTILHLNGNKLSGEIEPALGALAANLDFLGLDLNYNGLYSKNNTLVADLNTKQLGGEFDSTQTLDAIGVNASSANESTVIVNWNQVGYTQEGGYEVIILDDQGKVVGTPLRVVGKDSAQATIGGLEEGSKYTTMVKSFTSPHANNANEVVSDGLFGNSVEFFTKGADSDGDGIPDAFEGKPSLDTDGDGVPDFKDIDDDGDGFPTVDENPIDQDTDSDGTPDYLDSDDDGDGLSSADEKAVGTDPLHPDSDRDGHSDKEEIGPIDDPRDTDGDSLIDALDKDDDNDSLLTINEKDGDFDGDGVQNYLDNDDDGDGKPTKTEVLGDSGEQTDSDRDGAPDYLDSNDAKVTTSIGSGSMGLGLLALALVGLRRNARGFFLAKIALLSLALIFSGPLLAAEEAVKEQAKEAVEEAVGSKPPEEINFAKKEGAKLVEEADAGKEGVESKEAVAAQEVTETREAVDTQADETLEQATDQAKDKKKDKERLRRGGRLYVGAGVGGTKLDPDPGTTGFRVDDDSDFGAKIMFGYEATDHVAVEVFGATLGSSSLTDAGQVDGNVDYTSYGLTGIFNFMGRQGGFSPLIKLGIAQIENDANIPFERDEDLLFFGGVGLEYEFYNAVALRAEYEYYAEDAQMISLSLLKYFGGEKPKTIIIPPPAPPAAPVVNVEQPKISMEFTIPDTDNDGVNDVRDACPNTPEGARVDSLGCARFEGILRGVNFEYNKATLTPVAMELLDEVAAELEDFPLIKIQVEAHTDSRGSSTYNLWLSNRRAQSVIAYLGRQGINTSRLIPIGFGETKPIADNATDEGRALNRRVDFQVTKSR